MWCLNTVTWNHTVAFLSKAFWIYTAMINPVVVAAPGLTLIYTGFVPSSGSVALGSATRQSQRRRANGDLIGGWQEPLRSAVPHARRPVTYPPIRGGR